MTIRIPQPRIVNSHELEQIVGEYVAHNFFRVYAEYRGFTGDGREFVIQPIEDGDNTARKQGLARLFLKATPEWFHVRRTAESSANAEIIRAHLSKPDAPASDEEVISFALRLAAQEIQK